MCITINFPCYFFLFCTLRNNKIVYLFALLTGECFYSTADCFMKCLDGFKKIWPSMYKTVIAMSPRRIKN